MSQHGPSDSSYVEDERRPLPRDTVTLVLGILFIMDENEYLTLLNALPDVKGRSSFVLSVFSLLRLLLDQSVYDGTWLAMRLHELYAAENTLAWFGTTTTTINNNNNDDEDDKLEPNVYTEFFTLCLMLFGCEHIRRPAERPKRTALFVKQIQLSRHKQRCKASLPALCAEQWRRRRKRVLHCISALVPHLIALSVLEREAAPDVVDFAVDAYRDILADEMQKAQNVVVSEKASFEALDMLLFGGSTSHQQLLNCRSFFANVRSKLPFGSFVDELDELLLNAARLRQLPEHAGNEDGRAHLLVLLLRQLKRLEQMSMAERYCFMLKTMQRNLHNYIEAAVSALDHFDVLSWGNKLLPRMFASIIMTSSSHCPC